MSFPWIKRDTFIRTEVIKLASKVRDKYFCWLERVGVDENEDVIFKEHGLENVTSEDKEVLDKADEAFRNFARKKIYYLSFETAKRFYKGDMFLDLHGINFPDDWGLQSYDIDKENQLLGL